VGWFFGTKMPLQISAAAFNLLCMSNILFLMLGVSLYLFGRLILKDFYRSYGTQTIYFELIYQSFTPNGAIITSSFMP
jgi:hypothetical protein